MSKINYLNYESNPYGGAGYRGNMIQVGGASSDPIESYHATLRRYADSLMSFYTNLKSGDPRRQTLEDYRSQTAMIAEQYGFEDISSEIEGRGFGSNWDPLSGNIYGDSGVGAQGDSSGKSSTDQTGEVIWQYQDLEKNLIKYDGSDPANITVDLNSSDSRQIQKEFFQDDLTVKIPYHCTGRAELVPDDSVPEPTQMLKLTINLPNGKTETIIQHNFRKDVSHLHIQTPDGDSSKLLDTSLGELASQVDVTKIGDAESESTKTQGDTPSKRKDGKLGYDGNSFDIYSTSDGKDKYISARNNVKFHATSNTEYWTVEWNDGKYLVSVYDNSETTKSKAKETFTLDDMTNLKATFDIDPTHIEFKAPLGDAKDPHQPNSTDDHGKKLSFDEGSGSATTHKSGEPMHPGDTPPDPNSISNGQATWTGGNSNVEIHADPSDGINTYNVSTTGAVLLHGNTANDKVEVIKPFPGPDVNTLVVFTSPDGTKKTFGVKGTTNIIIDSSSDKMTVTGVDEFHIGNSFDAGNSEAKDLMERLQNATGADPESILKKLLEKYPTLRDYDKLINKGGNKNGMLDLNELQKAYKDGVFPPKNPDQNLIKFIYEIDSDFKDTVNAITIEPNMAMMRVATQKLVDVLQALYPDQTISATHPEAVGKDWLLANDILFGNGSFSFTGETNGTYNSIMFGWINKPTP